MSVHKSAHIDWMNEQEHIVDFEDEAAIVAMIDHAMAIEEAEEELFDHAANLSLIHI